MDTNKVEISGKIVRTLLVNNVYIMTLSTTKMVNGNVKHDYPQIIWYQNSPGREEAMKFRQYDRVRISGYVGSRTKIVDNQPSFYQNIIGESIREWVNMTDDMINLIELEGQVLHIYSPNNNFSSLRVAVNNERVMSKITLGSFGNVADFIKTQVNVGDRVHIYASIETTKLKKKNDKKPKVYETLVCTEIEKIRT